MHAHLDLDTALLPAACLIDGQWIAAQSGKTFDVTDPSTGEHLALVPDAGEVETRLAVDAAERALNAWKMKTASERSQVLRRFHGEMIDNIDALAAILTAEQGKPLAEARGEIRYAAAFLEWFAEEAKRAYGDIIPSNLPGRRIFVQKHPIGIVAAITPWNFPSAMITRKIGPALAAGCTIVLKPAQETPLSALALGVLAQRAGVPAGVFNVVTGAAVPIGSVLTGDPRVRKLSFTGSTQTGRRLLEQCAPTIKRTSMELGGNAPFIVFDDADLSAAVEGAIASKFRNAGQTCVCTNRLYVHSAIYEAFVSQLCEATSKLTVGPGWQATSAIGPLISEGAVRKAEHHIENAVQLGARIRIGGGRTTPGSWFFNPTVLSDVTADMLICQEETFGPVAAVVRFDTEDEVIALANCSEFGLAGYVYTRDSARIWRLADTLETGMLGVNTGLLSTEVAPFGGIKQSGHGREGSRYGLDDYLEQRYICLGD